MFNSWSKLVLKVQLKNLTTKSSGKMSSLLLFIPKKMKEKLKVKNIQTSLSETYLKVTMRVNSKISSVNMEILTLSPWTHPKKDRDMLGLKIMNLPRMLSNQPT